MPQSHRENQVVELFGAVRIQGIQSIVSVSASTWKAEETAKIELTRNQNKRKSQIIIQFTWGKKSILIPSSLVSPKNS